MCAECEEIEEEEEWYGAWPLRAVDLLCLGAALVRDLSQAVTTVLDSAVVLACQHANYVLERSNFHEQAALEIEQLTNGESDG